jgi:steroid delta-isomerase-like uncharacterized protein
MAAQDLVQKAKDHLAAFSAKDWNRYGAMLADDAVYEEEATRQRVQGKSQVIEAVKRWATAFPDLKGTVKQTHASGDRVVVEIVWDGTHQGPLTGPFGNIPATNKHGSVPAVEVVTFDGGLISEIRHYFDLMTILQQIGVAPRLGAAPQPTP